MRTFLAWGLLAALSLSARADVVDSGDQLIGGQGVFGGTLTVQGSAFSVGGSTFAVAGGSVTLGGTLNAAAAGIRWADGTISTTAVADGGPTTSSNNTWTGSNTWTSTAAFRGVVELGDPQNGSGPRSGLVVWAKSVDGVSRSSGCFGVISWNSNGEHGYVTWTATTTAAQLPVGGVLIDNNCAPASFCRVGIMGFFRMKCQAGFIVGRYPVTDSTACQADGQTSIGNAQSGYVIETCTNGWGTALLGGH